MASIKGTLEDAGDTIADTAKAAGRKLKAGAEQATDWVKDKANVGDGKGASSVKPHMDVIASCGMKIGTVDHPEGDTLKLTRSGSPDGQHHFIPMSWIDHVDTHVHLKKNSVESMQGWKADAASCSSCA